MNTVLVTNIEKSTIEATMKKINSIVAKKSKMAMSGILN